MSRTIVAVKIPPAEYDAFFKLIGNDLEFPASYSGWLKSSLQENAKHRSRGDIIKEIEVHPDEFTIWRIGAGLDPGLTALRAFAIAKAARQP